MLGNVVKWILSHIGGSVEQDLEKAIAATIEAGRFAADLAELDVGQTTTAPKVESTEFGKQFSVDIRITRVK